MTCTLNSKAVSSVCKGHSSSFYNSHRMNPVLRELERETNEFFALVKKKTSVCYDSFTARSCYESLVL